jgi:putative transposase
MSPKEIPDELIDQLLAGHEGPEAITGPDGLLKKLTKRVVERAMSAELTDHLGYELGEEPPEGQPNRRNGLTSKTLITDHGPVEVELPRDRDGSFEPQIIPKHQRRFAGFDDKIISMYARGMTTREISKHLEEIYGVEVGRDTISRVTDAVLDDVKEWQARPLEKAVSGRLARRDRAEDPRPGLGPKQARLPRDRRRHRWNEGDARDLARAE